MKLTNLVHQLVEVRIKQLTIVVFVTTFLYINIERETTVNAGDTSSFSSYVAKLDDFFNGIFLPAVQAFESIREQIRVDKEKTWQGMKHDDNNIDESWPKQYAVLIE